MFDVCLRIFCDFFFSTVFHSSFYRSQSKCFTVYMLDDDLTPRISVFSSLVLCSRLIEFLEMRIGENEAQKNMKILKIEFDNEDRETLTLSIDNDLPQIMSSEEEMSPQEFFLSFLLT